MRRDLGISDVVLFGSLHRGTLPVRSCVSAGRPGNRRAGRPQRARRRVGAWRAGHSCAGRIAGAGDHVCRMAAGRRCDVGESLRSCVRDAAPGLRYLVPARGDCAHAVRWLCQHGVLAAVPISAGRNRLAPDILGLRGIASLRMPAAAPAAGSTQACRACGRGGAARAGRGAQGRRCCLRGWPRRWRWRRSWARRWRRTSSTCSPQPD